MLHLFYVVVFECFRIFYIWRKYDSVLVKDLLKYNPWHLFFIVVSAYKGLFWVCGDFIQQSYIFYSKSGYEYLYAYCWLTWIWFKGPRYCYIIAGTSYHLFFCILFSFLFMLFITSLVSFMPYVFKIIYLGVWCERFTVCYVT